MLSVYVAHRIASEELSIQMLAGACVGGGTTINWTASFRTPKHVLHEWVQRFKLTSFQSELGQGAERKGRA